MLKKMKVFISVPAFLLLSLSLVMAQVATEVVKFYTIENASAVATTTYVSNATIVPEQSRILGFSVNPHSTGTSQGALWDEINTTTHHTDNMFGELSNPASKGDYYPFPYPKKITRQLRATLSANSNMVIYYTK
jgi:hypothetical protein